MASPDPNQAAPKAGPNSAPAGQGGPQKPAGGAAAAPASAARPGQGAGPQTPGGAPSGPNTQPSSQTQPGAQGQQAGAGQGAQGGQQAAVRPGAQDQTRQALQGQAARQGAQAGQTTVAPGSAGSNADKIGKAAQPVPPAHPRKADLDADRAALRNVASLEDYRSLVGSMRVLASEDSKKSVDLRVKKLKEALPKAKQALEQAYGKDKAAVKIKEFYDDRLTAIEAGISGRYKPKANEAATKIEQSGTVKSADQFDATVGLIDYAQMGPEELVTEQVLDETRGVMKVYDLGDLFERSMSPPTKDLWRNSGGGKEGFIAACKAQGTLAVAPPGGNPLTANLTVKDAFPSAISGFVGLGKDAGEAHTFAEAIQRFALAPKWYPSGAMLASHATAGDLKPLIAAGKTKIGKPSIFYLLRFDENTYEPKDRIFGHLADPNDPTKPGSALELQCSDLPQAVLIANGHILQ